MRFTLVNIFQEKDGLVDGAWVQNFTGTLEEAAKLARETETANSNRITVAVIENMYYTPFSNIYGAKRLDVKLSLAEKLDAAEQKAGAVPSGAPVKENER